VHVDGGRLRGGDACRKREQTYERHESRGLTQAPPCENDESA
jgi:hypothetical protein